MIGWRNCTIISSLYLALLFCGSCYTPCEYLYLLDYGEYTVTAGPASMAEPGHDTGLPVLEASVNAFTRLWLGIRPATGLAFTDDLKGPPDLLQALDVAFRLPAPQTDWDF